MSDPVNTWLAAQRDLIERWIAAPNANAAGDPASSFWQEVSASVSPKARELAQRLAELGPGFLAGAGDALYELFGAPRQSSGAAAQQPFGRWLDLAPIGYFREHHAQAQELARALDAYQRVSAQMAGEVARIHIDALEELANQTEALAAKGGPVSNTRRLYDLWIECAERAFAKHARAETFGRLQGELVNAQTRLRAAQQTVAEYLLKSLDLPTRAELNSVHKRLKDLRERIERLEADTSESATKQR